MEKPTAFSTQLELKIAHSIGQIDIDRTRLLQQKLPSPWASNLQISVFCFLMTEAHQIFKESDLCVKGNDMELFHFLSAGPYAINNAYFIFEKNKNAIEDLILRMKFIPFPPRKPKNYRAQAPEEYPPKDGYENNRQLNVIARSILISKDLVILWKKIGYHQICEDVNDLVIQGALLILFPPTPPAEWVKPDVETVKARLTELIGLGFQLNYQVIIEIFHLFENRLKDIGDTLIRSFSLIKNESPENLLTKTNEMALIMNKQNVVNFCNGLHRRVISNQPRESYSVSIRSSHT